MNGLWRIDKSHWCCCLDLSVAYWIKLNAEVYVLLVIRLYQMIHYWKNAKAYVADPGFQKGWFYLVPKSDTGGATSNGFWKHHQGSTAQSLSLCGWCPRPLPLTPSNHQKVATPLYHGTKYHYSGANMWSLFFINNIKMPATLYSQSTVYKVHYNAPFEK